MHLQILIVAILALFSSAMWFLSWNHLRNAKYKSFTPPWWARWRPRWQQIALCLTAMTVILIIKNGGHASNLDGGMALLCLGVLADEDFQREVLGGVESLRTDTDKMKRVLNEQHAEITKLRQRGLSASGGGQARPPRRVSDACARHIAALFWIGNARAGRLDVLPERVREQIFTESRSILGIETRTALTTTDIPLPSEFFGEIRELISEFGVARKNMFPFPIGMGTAKPPRFKTRPAFGSIAMSATVTEKSPQIDYASLESHKIGGLVRVPRELDEQSAVPMGQFLARYGAVEFARAEDTWAFLADGSGTYESVKGITKIAKDNSKVTQLATGGLSPNDVTLANLRSLRSLVNAGALNQGAQAAYYLHSTWEYRLRDFNSANDPFIFVPNRPTTRDAIGGPTLDGYPIVWTDILQPFTTADVAANTYVAVFGALEYWWFGEHGSPRMDFSSDVFFGTDELATRFIEEIDFDYQDLGAAAALQLAAS